MDGSKSTTDMVVLFLNRMCSMRLRCQYYFAKPMSKRMRTYVKNNAKSMSRLMRSRGRDGTLVLKESRLADDGKRIQCDGRFCFVR